MKRLSRVIGVATLALMATAGPAMATRGQPDRTVPINGTVSGEHWIVPQAEDCVVPDDAVDWWRFSSTGSGQMSHLGSVDYFLTQCTYVVPPVGPISGGTVTFTAANDDTLVVAQSLQSQIIGEFPFPDAFTVEGSWEVSRGTGRFANATGSGTLDGIGDIPNGVPYFDDLPDGLAQFNFHGEIAYAASDRSSFGGEQVMALNIDLATGAHVYGCDEISWFGTIELYGKTHGMALYSISGGVEADGLFHYEEGWRIFTEKFSVKDGELMDCDPGRLLAAGTDVGVWDTSTGKFESVGTVDDATGRFRSWFGTTVMQDGVAPQPVSVAGLHNVPGLIGGLWLEPSHR